MVSFFFGLGWIFFVGVVGYMFYYRLEGQEGTYHYLALGHYGFCQGVGEYDDVSGAPSHRSGYF